MLDLICLCLNPHSSNLCTASACISVYKSCSWEVLHSVTKLDELACHRFSGSSIDFTEFLLWMRLFAGSTEVTNDMLPSYLVPANRYIYWTPHGLRDMKSKKSHRNLPLGIRTSPFASLWHVSTKPVISKKAFRYLWTEQQKKMQVAETSKVRRGLSLPVSYCLQIT